MANIYHSIKAHFTPDILAKLSTLLGESETHVKPAVDAAVPTLLAGFLEKGKTEKMKTFLEEVYKKNVLTEKEGVHPTEDHEKLELGQHFLTDVVGGHEPTLPSVIASEDKMSAAKSKRLLVMVSTVVAGFLAKHLHTAGGSIEKLYEEVDADHNEISAAVPAEFRGKFTCSNQHHHPEAVHPKPAAAAAKAPDPKCPAPKCPAPAEGHETRKKKCSLCWLWWLLGILVLLLLVWWLMRGCCGERGCKVVETEVVEVQTPVVRDTYELSLPNGQSLTVFRGGLEDQIVKFLQSDTYEDATDTELANHWFEFDNLDFEFDSATELTAGSEVQLGNLVAILEHFSNARILIGGNADEVGGERPNMSISEQRANTIRNRMIAAGIAEGRVSTEGFGKEHATIPATATNAERAPDRDIAIRFTK